MKLTEKQRKCLYCHSSKLINTFTDNWNSPLASKNVVLFHSAAKNEDKYFEISTDYGQRVGVLVEFNFCPECGRPLNEEED